MKIAAGVIAALSLAGGWAWGYFHQMTLFYTLLCVGVGGFIGSSILAAGFCYLYFFSREEDAQAPAYPLGALVPAGPVPAVPEPVSQEPAAAALGRIESTPVTVPDPTLSPDPPKPEIIVEPEVVEPEVVEPEVIKAVAVPREPVKNKAITAEPIAAEPVIVETIEGEPVADESAGNQPATSPQEGVRQETDKEKIRRLKAEIKQLKAQKKKSKRG